VKFARILKISCRIAAICAGFGSATAWGQVANVPFGSPLDPTQTNASTSIASGSPVSGNSSQSNNANSSQNPFTNNQTYGAVNVADQGSSTSVLSLDQLLASNKLTTENADNVIKKPASPGEFEKYVDQLLGRKIPLFGTKLVLPSLRDFAAPATATVPPDYIVQPGDTIDVALSGSLDGSVLRNVDTNGLIFLTGVGSVHVAGIRNSDLHEVISRAIGTKFRGFTVAVTITKLRGIRVYVTGLANNPGAFTVSSLSTLANGVFQAGGPNSGGSWRSIKLYRNGHQVADFDLYQLMRGGSRVNDVQLQNEDVLFIPPAGPQVAVVGSVSEEGIFEAKPGESIADMLAAAGGPNTVADSSRYALYHSNDPNQTGPLQFAMASAGTTPITPGDIVQLLSTGTLTMPIARQKILVRVEGEVEKPDIYYVTPGTRTSDVIAAAGGLTTRAYPFGTVFRRESERIRQQQSYSEALNQLEISLAAAPLSQDPTFAAGDRNAQLASARAVLERLRQANPDGRVVIDIAPTSSNLPGDIALENNDTIYVPERASTVGVFGAVYRPASFFVDGLMAGKRVRDYIEEAGGVLRSADKGGVFVVRANGAVISHKRGAFDLVVVPGDVVFVPVRTQPNLIWAKIRDVVTTLIGFGLTTAAVVAVTK
jgi:protein involved in polysaccharide export with SLBB domain